VSRHPSSSIFVNTKHAVLLYYMLRILIGYEVSCYSTTIDVKYFVSDSSRLVVTFIDVLFYSDALYLIKCVYFMADSDHGCINILIDA